MHYVIAKNTIKIAIAAFALFLGVAPGAANAITIPSACFPGSLVGGECTVLCADSFYWCPSDMCEVAEFTRDFVTSNCQPASTAENLILTHLELIKILPELEKRRDRAFKRVTNALNGE